MSTSYFSKQFFLLLLFVSLNLAFKFSSFGRKTLQFCQHKLNSSLYLFFSFLFPFNKQLYSKKGKNVCACAQLSAYCYTRKVLCHWFAPSDFRQTFARAIWVCKSILAIALSLMLSCNVCVFVESGRGQCVSKLEL